MSIETTLTKTSLARGDALKTYYKNIDRNDFLLSVSNYGANSNSAVASTTNSDLQGLKEQEIYARLHHNRIYVGKNVTDKVGQMILYKHQVLASRYLFLNDSLLVIHEPGTGKTKTNLNAMMVLLASRAITMIYIINKSDASNKVALTALKELYEELFRNSFNMSFSQFRRKYIVTSTLSSIHKPAYADNIGIIIDEAHNIMSDTTGEKPQKVGNLEEFIRKLSEKRGAKLILASATPIFGEIDNLFKIKEILFRAKDLGIAKIPQFMISYTKINYDHLVAEHQLNPKFRSEGIRDFEMDNGKKFVFRLYENKPAPAQIADFYEPLREGKKDMFQTLVRPIIIQSKSRDAFGQLSQPGIDENHQSTILNDVIDAIERTKDGTVIIYASLKKEGVYAVAKALESRGFENFIKEKHTTMVKKNLGISQNRKIDQYNSEIIKLISQADELRAKDTRTIESHLRNLKNQASTLSINSDFKPFINYVENYEKRLLKDKHIREEISEIETQITKLESSIKELKIQEKKKIKKATPKYLIYTSGMSAREKEAFTNVFNSDRNWDGSQIKVIIGSQVMRDGVNIFHAVQTHLLMSEWRMPGNIQAQFRGFRSDGHEALIHNRAILLADKEKISYTEAKEKIRMEKIKVEIYYHALDFGLLTLEDVEEAIPYMPLAFQEEKPNPADILQQLQSDENRFNGGMILYETAISKHKKVGAELMKLQSSSIDYMLNVRGSDRIEDAVTDEDREYQERNTNPESLFGVKDTELFFMNDYMDFIIDKILELLFVKGYIMTDELVDKILEKNKILSVELISTAIIELVKNRGFAYNPYTGIDMLIKLWETEEESILYFCTSEHNSHPYNAHVEKIGFSITTPFERIKTIVTEKDLELPKNDHTFYKLKDAIEHAIETESNNRNTASNTTTNIITLEFLEQMSNYWAVEWNEEQGSPEKVYVFKRHIKNPGSNIFAEGLVVHEYDIFTKKWNVTNTTRLKKVVFVRYITLFRRYLEFNFNLYGYTNVNNGYALIKDIFDPMLEEDDYLDKMFGSPSILAKDVMRNVVIKQPGKNKSVGSKGSQFLSLNIKGSKSDKDKVTDFLALEMQKNPMFIFFLYNKNKSAITGRESFFDIKKREKEEMISAMNGEPTLRFQLDFLERDKNLTPERKKELYKKMYAF